MYNASPLNFYHLIRSALFFLFLIAFSSTSTASMVDEERQYLLGFEKRLRETFNTWSWDNSNTETYYTLLTSNPLPTQHPPEAGIMEVTFKAGDQNEIKDGVNLSHTFTLNDSSLKIDLNQLPSREVTLNEVLGDNKLFPIKVTRQDQTLNLTWKFKEEKRLFMRAVTDLSSTIQAARNGCWYRKLIATTNIPPSASCRTGLCLEVEVEYRQKHTLALKGMAVSYNKDRRKTGIFFDRFYPIKQGKMEYLPPFTPDLSNIELIDHEKLEINNNETWYRVNKEIWEYPTKKIIYKIFSNDQQRSQWIPQDKQFIRNLSTGIYAPLPTQYEYVFADESRKKLKENQPTKILTKLDPTKYYRYLTGQQPFNSDYLYANGHGKFFPTLCFQARWTGVPDQKVQDVQYLYHTTPEIGFKQDVTFLTPGTWQQGVYKVVRANDTRETWKLEDDVDIQKGIEFIEDERFYFPELQINETNVKTIQKFNPIKHVRLPFRFGHISVSFCDSLKSFTKVTELNLSNASLDEDLTWHKVFESIGSLIHLTSLNLSFNNFGISRVDPLGECLVKLTALKTLQLQGQSLIESNPPNFKVLCHTLASKATQLQNLHIDNLPGKMCYPYKAAIPIFWPFVFIDTVVLTSDPQGSIEPSANSLVSLPCISSLVLYQRAGDACYNYNEQEIFEQTIRRLAPQKGKRNLQIGRITS